MLIIGGFRRKGQMDADGAFLASVWLFLPKPPHVEVRGTLT
jgi:hypothetical protein